MTEIIFDKVSKDYSGPVHAVRDLSLTVAEGELLVIVGPSGCGKSTILRMIAGLEKIDSGTITIDGRVVNDLPPKNRDVAMVFQDYALYPHMTASKNMAFALRLNGTSKTEIQLRVQETAQLLGITDILHRKPGELSGGQQQRVALGRAIARQPRCLLLDEPLSNLDAKRRYDMRRELKAIHHRGSATIIHVTHDQEEAMSIGDRVVVINEGSLQQVGTPMEVYRRPANLFVAGFIGSPPMNLIPGRLMLEDGAVRFENGAGIDLRLKKSIPGELPRETILGIRPESLSLDDNVVSESLACAFTADIISCEPVGDRMDVVAQISDAKTITARVPAIDAIKPGQKVKFTVDRHAIHLFEADSPGLRIIMGEQ